MNEKDNLSYKHARTCGFSSAELSREHGGQLAREQQRISEGEILGEPCHDLFKLRPHRSQENQRVLCILSRRF